MTIKEIRKKMRAMEGNAQQTLTIPGWGCIKKIGDRYCAGPLPEHDDSDPLTGYSAWIYCLREKWILDDIQRRLGIA